MTEAYDGMRCSVAVADPEHTDWEAGVREIALMLWQEATSVVKARMAYVLLLSAAAPVLTALSPVILKLIIDDFGGQSRSRFVSVPTLVILYVLALWLARTTLEVRGLVFARAEQRLLRTLSERLFSHLMHLPLRFHLNRQTGAVSQVLDNGLQGLRVILRQLVFTCVPVGVELVTALVVLIGLAMPQFSLLYCSAMVCYAVAFTYSAATITKTGRGASAARVEATAAITDGVLNYETVKYFTAEGLVGNRVARALARSEVEWIRFYRRYATNGLVVAAVFAMFLAATIAYSTKEVAGGRMTVGDFVLVNSYMLQIVRPVEMLGYAVQGLSQGVAMLEKLVQLFREPPENAPQTGKGVVDGIGSLEFREVTLSYGAGRQVFSKVSFSVEAGRTLGIVGPSGSGKSTIVRLLTRLLEPTAGNILLDGVSVSDIALQDLRRSIAVVPQDTVLLDGTLRYNIALGRSEASLEQVEDAARIAQLDNFVARLPDGYDTMVGERGVKLSGGERQRVSIARAVLKAPRIFVFDEATSSLDSRTELEILRSLRDISKSNTTLVIGHRLATVIHADEIIVLENGRIVERGTHRSLLARNGRYTVLWKAQQGGAVA